jgi:lysophospholipase L1-like esterase
VKKNIILFLFSLLIAIIAGEIILRLAIPANELNYVIQPNINFVYIIDEDQVPGIYNDSRFISNSIGSRNQSLPNTKHVFYAIGGSTTECLLLDQKETWPQLVEDYLNDDTNSNYWIGNLGKSGSHTQHHVVQLENLLANSKEKIELIFFMVGINDMGMFLIDSSDYLNPNTIKIKSQAFALKKAESAWAYPRLIEKIKTRANQKKIGPVIYHNDFNAFYPVLRKRRAQAKEFRNKTPNLNAGLDQFRDHILKLIQISQSNEVIPVFITQAAMYNDSLDQFQKSLLWMGGAGQFMHQDIDTYYSPSSLDKILKEFNKVILETTMKSAVACIDISNIESDTTSFYDDCHFNESGAQKVAKIIHQALIDQKLVRN